MVSPFPAPFPPFLSETVMPGATEAIWCPLDSRHKDESQLVGDGGVQWVSDGMTWQLNQQQHYLSLAYLVFKKNNLL